MIDVNIERKLRGSAGPIILSLDLQIKKGEFVVLTGPSGAGKTSTLRILSGLMDADLGHISVGDLVWFDSKKNISLSPQSRRAGIVFQEYALFPNMTVRKNLEYALRKNQENEIVEELIEVTELGNLQNEFPNELSGGQKQRVALARSLVQRPKLLLLDEPLSALDRKMRFQLQDYLINVHCKYELTTIMVTHDTSEILRLADLVYVLDEGHVTESGRPTEIFAEHNISGKFRFTGEILEIKDEGFIKIITVLIQNNAVKVIGDHSEHSHLSVGDKVLVASKAFNPIIKKL